MLEMAEKRAAPNGLELNSRVCLLLAIAEKAAGLLQETREVSDLIALPEDIAQPASMSVKDRRMTRRPLVATFSKLSGCASQQSMAANC